MRAHYPAAADRVLTIHNGVDIAAFAPGAHCEQARALRSSQTTSPKGSNASVSSASPSGSVSLLPSDTMP